MSKQFVRCLVTFDGQLLTFSDGRVPEVEHTTGLMQETANRLTLNTFGLDTPMELLCKVSDPFGNTEIYYFKGKFDVPKVPVKRLYDMGPENCFAARCLLEGGGSGA